jgi:hypothetical protein
MLYEREDEEAYTVASAIAPALGPGDGNAGWSVSGPRPVMEEDALPHLYAHPKNVPLIMGALSIALFVPVASPFFGSCWVLVSVLDVAQRPFAATLYQAVPSTSGSKSAIGSCPLLGSCQRPLT